MPTSDQRRRAGSSRARRFLLLTGVALALSGCLQAGESLVSDELERVRAIRDFGVVASAPERVVFAARGRRIVVEPAPGSCIARDSIEVSRSLAFLVVSDCVIEQAAALTPDDADAVEIALPASFPGVITVSISGAPMDDTEGGGEAAAEKLRAFLESPEGRGQLGRSADPTMIEVAESRVVGDTLYVLVKDRSGDASPLLAPEFWRAFVELNGRMTLVTISGFSDRPMSSEAMLRRLASQVSALRAANGLPMAEAIAGELPAALPPERVNDRATKIAPFLSPMVAAAPRRTGSQPAPSRATAETPAPSRATAETPVAAPGGDASRQAPGAAPSAPPRPKGA
ncbi:hypothetical protein M1105_00090 [Limibaculum sp. FT325]|uniref:hypothetical protein n=1 Tax=Thermohalobaculum sediminis TaxID=2939436 RepID=UPI0020C0E054|nr:hypothetical protein [Limibaculum sediminis]MCL5775396.1 hypothetical protein [Limibaculum sediminis]